MLSRSAAGPASPCGHRMHERCTSSARSTGGRSESCTPTDRRACGATGVRGSARATLTGCGSPPATASGWRNPTRSPPTRPSRLRSTRSSPTSTITGRTGSGCRAEGQPRRSTRRSRSTRSISDRGAGRWPMAAGSRATSSSPTRSPTTPCRTGSPTSNCCRSWSIRSTDRGGTRPPDTSLRPLATVRRSTRWR